MKKDWEERSLGDICEFRNGLWKGKKPPFIKAKVIRMTNFTKDCEMNNKEPIELEVEKKQFESRNLTEGDLLIEKSGGGPNQPVGRVVRFKSKDNANYSFSNFTTRMRIIDQSNISSRYLHKFFKLFYLSGKTEKFQKNSTNIRNLQLKYFKEIQIPLPSIQEQKRIVEKLDTCMEQIDKAIQNVEQNIQNAEDLFQSKLNEIFSQKDNDWETKKLGDISRLTYGITGKAYDSGDYRYVRITDIDDYGKLSYKNKKYLKNQNECANFILKENDLVMARTGATFGKLLLYKDIEPSVYASYLIKIEFINDISNELYWFFTKTKIYWDQANSLSTGSAQPHFNGAALKEVLFSYPISKNKQKILIQKFYEQFSLSQSIKLNYQKEILALKELKQSILEKAFNGEL